MTNKPTTEMKLKTALEALRALTSMLHVDRAEDGPDHGKLRLFYVDSGRIDRWLFTETTNDQRHFLETLGEALDNARAVTGELRFP